MPASESSNFTNAEDLRLVGRVHEGDLQAFSSLVQRHQVRIYNTVYALVGDADEADDLSQEVFIKVFRSLKNFRGQSQFYTWIYRIAVNCCLDHLKARNRRNLVSLHDHLETAEAAPSGSGKTTDARVVRREMQEMLEWALDQLPDEYRTTMVLREIDGHSYEDIAALLNCSVGTVKSRLFRARTRLRDLLDVHYKAWFEA